MKILFLCGRELSYTRNSVIYTALTKNFEVVNITAHHKKYWRRYLSVITKFLFTKHNYDCIYVGFYGQPLVLLIRLFTRKPIIFDAYISTYQTLCFDRKKFSPTSIIGKTVFYLDMYACKAATHVILDTQAHIDYFVETYKLNPEKFTRVFVGADESKFFPIETTEKGSGKKVFFYCEYQPLHGVEYIIKAAKLLEHTDITFTLVGKGQQRSVMDTLASELAVKNITFTDWVPYNKLPLEIAHADICIGGHLGNTEKANMVIAGKTFQFIAMKKLTLVAKNKANPEFLPDIARPYYIEPANEKDLADNIVKLFSEPSVINQLAEEQHNLYIQKASRHTIAEQLQKIFTSIL